MRHQSSGRRSRNRGGGRRGGHNNRSQVFDSNGPDVRIRGTAHQIHEKYVALAKDATGSGDLILAESYLQHAEHYQRVINGWDEADGKNKQESQNDGGFEGRQKDRTRVPKQNDDLGLPASITGEEKVSDKKEELEDA